MKERIDNKLFYRRLYTLSAPIIVQNLMLALVAACDALMLGRVAQEQMAAVSLATQIQFVQNMFILAVTSAGAILGSQYYGKGDLTTIEKLFHMILRWAGAISLVFFLLCEGCPGLLMRIFAHDDVMISIGSA